MTVNRLHTARKPVGSGSQFRPVPEYSPPIGQMTSSPYVNALPIGKASASPEPSRGGSARRHSHESAHSDHFFDTEQQPEGESVATGHTTETTSPTVAQAPPMYLHHAPSQLSHRFDSTRRWEQPSGYQKLTSEGPESASPDMTQYATFAPTTSHDSPLSQYSGTPAYGKVPVAPHTSTHSLPAHVQAPQKQDSHPYFKQQFGEQQYRGERDAPASSASPYSQPLQPSASQPPGPLSSAPHHSASNASATYSPYSAATYAPGPYRAAAAPPPDLPQPQAAFGVPFRQFDGYSRVSSAYDDNARESSDRSVSPTQSLGAGGHSSQSLSSDPSDASSVPAAVSELPPGALYQRQVSTSARPQRGRPLTLASLANRNSSAELSPRASTTRVDSPASLSSPYAAYGAPAAIPSPASDQPSDAGSRTSATSLSGASQASRAPRDVAPPPLPKQRTSKPKDESLGIGVGSAYIHRMRVDAAETHISKVPASLPVGIRARAKSSATRIQPAFLRKAMDIRYTHLPQRMLETEVDDDETPQGQQQFPATTAPPNPRVPSPPLDYDGLDPSRRSSSPVESVMERTGKIKLFVANPDDDSD